MPRVASYTRVSTQRQEKEGMIRSQEAELRSAIMAEGFDDWIRFKDEGYSRDDLDRPDLDRLRDLADAGELDILFVPAPDRLASGPKFVLLVEELRENGVEVRFLNGNFEETPEGDLQLQVVGMFSQYEKAKIAERTRRGKLYWARQGFLPAYMVPLGFEFVARHDSNRATLTIHEERAAIVRDIFRWCADECATTRGIAKRLMDLGIPTARGGAHWYPTTIRQMLRNPAYKGEFTYRRTERIKGHASKKKTRSRPRPRADWIVIPVPAIVDEATWDRVQTQLVQNAAFSTRNQKRHSYLLRGMIECPRCGRKYTGAARNGRRRYRCSNTDRVVGAKSCAPGSVSADLIEKTVWDAVTAALMDPGMLMAEYQLRLGDASSRASFETERKQINVALRRVGTQEDRVADAYLNEAFDVARVKREMDALRSRKAVLDQRLRDLDSREQIQIDSQAAMTHLERFCKRVTAGIANLDFDKRQKLMRLVIERVVVQDHRVRIETVIPPDSGDDTLRTRDPELDSGSGRICGR